MPVLRSQTVYLSITVFLSLALSQQHTLLLSHVPCFVSASRCSCSLMGLALSQHHAALSCALLCLSITLLLLSHVPCFVSISITLHSISCRSYSHVPSFVPVLLSQVLCFVSASLTPFLLSLMCLIFLVTVLVHVHCFVSTSRRSYVVSGYHAALQVLSMCLALSGSASRCSLKCFTSASRRSCALPCLSMTSRRSSVLCLFP